MHVILIAGGWSDEREVSLSGAKKIRTALEELGHRVTFFDPAQDFRHLVRTAREADFAFINLHGTPGEDGLIQAMLDKAGCPYQGAGAAASYLALDKGASKEVFETLGIDTPPWQFITPTQGADTPLALPLPVFVKPNKGGSSLGMSLVRTAGEFPSALSKVFAMCQSALVEIFIPGVELTCAVLGDRPLPLIMITPKAGAPFFDYENKYAADGAEEVCPAPVSDAVTRLVQERMLAAHNALGLTGYSRGDFILAADGTPYLLEINTLPGMTPTSLLPRAAGQVGLSFAALISELIRLGLEERGR
ncbi:MAG: D-alanine--D-alanine ligase [Pseudodesulfovibrio sp.]|uniref:D-alanine--D-alanine ligase n=1 Tax=Pseudodesulfovibrio aespoeensis (strain ATCC 700646 / DSM 10631 / Aspo-2) TaxID=643562 RepID=E6VTC3_PSEA9|nr:MULTISPECIES: D-alanine--D-alanine ligase [Pseudodesulfovibrio]MBU4192478.1 D-alanine--D-alanine ligase [Pseudomonadota bacterium]ADU63282.1 D-alanine/D-alanine ligase [Pseudodesulfovibrio aespoeensis Aspo-2]MBU4245337.1 D-alanine--D-alanine ligase [Pseudomonadota bacterium]MBU4378161.1 D-alanine--D-alanine ligase [Pseudomonadota bacterium]MBU4474980.1 D-alanine--D-alanine ligase [Pseudomonadota bacterium]